MHWRIRDPLSKPLMGSGLIKVLDIAHEKSEELLLIEDQKMIQTFPPHTQEKAFTPSIRAARVRYGVRSTLISLVAATRAKAAQMCDQYPGSGMWVLLHTQWPPVIVARPRDRSGLVSH
jgi:hypothetical protein